MITPENLPVVLKAQSNLAIIIKAAASLKKMDLTKAGIDQASTCYAVEQEAIKLLKIIDGMTGDHIAKLKSDNQ
jgi:hypothetical protein